MGSKKPTDIATITADNEKPDLKKEVKMVIHMKMQQMPQSVIW